MGDGALVEVVGLVGVGDVGDAVVDVGFVAGEPPVAGVRGVLGGVVITSGLGWNERSRNCWYSLLFGA